MKCLVVDDELLARNLLIEYIGKMERLTLVKSCADAIEAMNFIQKNSVDIIFLDINMPELGGLDFLKAKVVLIGTTEAPVSAMYRLQLQEKIMRENG